MITKTQDLPEDYKHYLVTMSDKTQHMITGRQKVAIMQSPSQFIELQDGTIINKAHIVSIDFLKDKTKDEFKKIEASEQRKIMGVSDVYLLENTG